MEFHLRVLNYYWSFRSKTTILHHQLLNPIDNNGGKDWKNNNELPRRDPLCRAVQND